MNSRTGCQVLVTMAISSFAAWSQDKESMFFSTPFITTVMKKVCDWQLQNPVAINEKNENDWARAAFYTGVMATYRTTHEKKYLDAAITWSESWNWKLANRLRHADDHARGQTYLEIHEIKKNPMMIEDVK